MTDTDTDTATDAIVGLMDFTLLDHSATDDQLRVFCERASSARPAAVCVFSEHVAKVKSWLSATEEECGSGRVALAAVCGGFPIGSSNISEVVESISEAVTGGADEIDIVLEPRVPSARPGIPEAEFLTACREACQSLVLKVILETPLLSEEVTRFASELSLSNGADFIKSCTGKRGGCSLDAARVMATELKKFEMSTGNKRGIKISGGIQTKKQAIEMLALIVESHPSILSGDDMQYCRQDRERIRIGASSLMKDLLPQLYEEAQPLSDNTTNNDTDVGY